MILCIDWDWNWTAIGVIIAAAALFYTIRTLRKNSDIAAFQIYMKIADKIDLEKTHEIRLKCESKLSEEIQNDTLKFENGTDLPGSQLRIYLLLPLSDLALFWQQKLISLDAIHHGFRTLIIKVCNSETILAYIRHLRLSDDFAYKDLEALYIEIYKKLPVEKRKNLKPNFKA